MRRPARPGRRPRGTGARSCAQDRRPPAGAASLSCVPQRPRFDDPEIHERYRAQVAVERDVLVRLPGYRRGEEPDLLDDPGEMAALARERQSQRRRRHFEPVLAVGRGRGDRGLGHRQVRGGLVQPSPGKFAGRARERDIRPARSRRLGGRPAGAPGWSAPARPVSGRRSGRRAAAPRRASHLRPGYARMASTISPCSVSHRAASRCRAGSSSGNLRRSSSRSRSAKRW